MSHLGNDIVIEQAHEALLEEVEHDCEMLSTCCGAGENEFVENFCNGCNEFAEFECASLSSEREY